MSWYGIHEVHYLRGSCGHALEVIHQRIQTNERHMMNIASESRGLRYACIC